MNVVVITDRESLPKREDRYQADGDGSPIRLLAYRKWTDGSWTDWVAVQEPIEP